MFSTTPDPINNQAAALSEDRKKPEIHLSQTETRPEVNTTPASQKKECSALILSTQDLDTSPQMDRISLRMLSPENINDLYLNRNLNYNPHQQNNGHTGASLAIAMKAHFMVMRSKANRSHFSTWANTHQIANHAFVIITGHGNAGVNDLSGQYEERQQKLQQSDDLKSFSPPNTISRRTAVDFVETMLCLGLTKGSHLNILLATCHGGKKGSNGEQSFAGKLSDAFTKVGISTTIVATTDIFVRITIDSIRNDVIQFGDNTGIKRGKAIIIDTKIEDHNGDTKKTVNEYIPGIQMIRATDKGLCFDDSSINQLFNPEKSNITDHLQSPEQAADDDYIDYEESYGAFKRFKR